VFDREGLAGAREAGLDLIGDEQMPCLSHNARSARRNSGGAM
jgi:hypothetical protein